jgi:hypothetical protein
LGTSGADRDLLADVGGAHSVAESALETDSSAGALGTGFSARQTGSGVVVGVGRALGVSGGGHVHASSVSSQFESRNAVVASHVGEDLRTGGAGGAAVLADWSSNSGIEVLLSIGAVGGVDAAVVGVEGFSSHAAGTLESVVRFQEASAAGRVSQRAVEEAHTQSSGG